MRGSKDTARGGDWSQKATGPGNNEYAVTLFLPVFINFHFFFWKYDFFVDNRNYKLFDSQLDLEKIGRINNLKK